MTRAYTASHCRRSIVSQSASACHQQAAEIFGVAANDPAALGRFAEPERNEGPRHVQQPMIVLRRFGRYVGGDQRFADKVSMPA